MTHHSFVPTHRIIYTQVVSGAEPSKNAALRLTADPKKLSELYEASSYFTPPVVQPEKAKEKGKDKDKDKGAGAKKAAVTRVSPFPTSTWNQIGTLLRRMWIAQRCVGSFVFVWLHLVPSFVGEVM